MFTHSSRRISLDHCRNASIFESALGQIRLRAATVSLDNNKLSLLHGFIIWPDERESVPTIDPECGARERHRDGFSWPTFCTFGEEWVRFSS